jgi:hypothetical protein
MVMVVTLQKALISCKCTIENDNYLKKNTDVVHAWKILCYYKVPSLPAAAQRQVWNDCMK